jgi:hypothetical protein
VSGVALRPAEAAAAVSGTAGWKLCALAIGQ